MNFDQTFSRGRKQLVTALLVMAGLWLFVFPMLSRNEAIQQKIAERERQGIELSAMFYTELGVQEKHQAIDRMVENHPAALWNPWAFRERSPERSTER